MDYYDVYPNIKAMQIILLKVYKYILKDKEIIFKDGILLKTIHKLLLETK